MEINRLKQDLGSFQHDYPGLSVLGVRLEAAVQNPDDPAIAACLTESAEHACLTLYSEAIDDSWHLYRLLRHDLIGRFGICRLLGHERYRVVTDQIITHHSSDPVLDRWFQALSNRLPEANPQDIAAAVIAHGAQFVTQTPFWRQTLNWLRAPVRDLGAPIKLQYMDIADWLGQADRLLRHPLKTGLHQWTERFRLMDSKHALSAVTYRWQAKPDLCLTQTTTQQNTRQPRAVMNLIGHLRQVFSDTHLDRRTRLAAGQAISLLMTGADSKLVVDTYHQRVEAVRQKNRAPVQNTAPRSGRRSRETLLRL